jgi:cation transport regulator ChaC
MLTKANSANGLSGREAGYLEAIEDCLKEMAAVRKGMKKADVEIRQLRASSRRKLDETWTIIRRVQATL